MDNIFRKLRNEHTKKNNWDEPFTQTKLAKELGIRQQTVDKVEHGYSPSYNTVKAYHDYFKVPYDTLFGDGIALQQENVSVSKELRLSDNAINNIRELSPRSLALLDCILSDKFIKMQLENLFNSLYSMDNHLQDKSHTKMDSGYGMLKYLISESFTTFMLEELQPVLAPLFREADKDRL